MYYNKYFNYKNKFINLKGGTQKSSNYLEKLEEMVQYEFKNKQKILWNTIL